MFPSSGYFRGLDCPFYASGLCERPYCHYRHTKRNSYNNNNSDIQKDPTWIGKSTTTTTTTNNQKQQNNHSGDTTPSLPDTKKDKGLLIEKAAPLLNEVEVKPLPPKSTSSYSCTSNKDLTTKVYTYKPHVATPNDNADSAESSKYKPYTKYNCDGKSNYQPTCDNQAKKGRYEEYTISSTKKENKKVNEYNCDIASNSVPEYNPTPISELKRMHRYSTQSTTHSDLEYDPVSNFDAGFSNKSFFNLLDNSYSPTTSSQSVGDPTSGHSVYKPTKIPSEEDDEEHELVIDAKFSDDSDEEAVSSRLSDQGSDSETRGDPTESEEPVFSFSNHNIDDFNYSTHSPIAIYSDSHKSSVEDDSKEVAASSNDDKHVKTDSKSSSNEKLKKISKSDVKNDFRNDVKKHNSSETTTDSNKRKTTLDDKNKLERNKSSSSSPDKIAKKKKISENERSSSSEKKSSSSDKRTSSTTSEKKVSSSSHDKISSSEKKVSSSSSSSSDKKSSSGLASSSSSSRDQSSIKKEPSSNSSSREREKSAAAEKLRRFKESSRILHNEKEVNGSSEKDRSERDRSSEKDRSVKEKEHRKSESDRNGSNAAKERTKDENRRHESSSSSSTVKKSSGEKSSGDKSSGEHGVKKKSNSQTKTDSKTDSSNKVKSDPERKKDFERRKSEGERKGESDSSKRPDAVRRKSESGLQRSESEKEKKKDKDKEKEKDSTTCKNSLYLKRKESDKKEPEKKIVKEIVGEKGEKEKGRQGLMSSAKGEKLQRLKELNERVGVWKANRTEPKTDYERDKIPEKIRKTESSKVSDSSTKKKLTHSSSDSKRISSNASNNTVEKSSSSKKREREREYSGGENSHSHEHPAKMIKRENSKERHGCSSSDENPPSISKRHSSSDLAGSKNSKHKISNSNSNSESSKQRHSSSSSGVIKDKKNRSISIDDLFGEESEEEEEEEEESSGAFGNSGGDESTGLSDDDELNVIFGDTDLSENDPYEECLRIFNESNTQALQQQRQEAKAAEFAKKLQKKDIVLELPDIQDGKKRVAHAAASARDPGDRLKKFARPAIARPSPAQVMHNRLLEKQKRFAGLKPQKETPLNKLPARAPSNLLSSLSSKHSKMSLLKHRMSLPKIGTPESCSFNSERTIVGTAEKSGKRTAHMPKKDVLKRPTIAAEYGSKITALVRQRYLNLIIDEYIKLIPCAEKAMSLGVHDEAEVYKNCNSKLGYLNKAIHLIKRLRGNNIDVLRISTTDNEMIPNKIPTSFPEEPKLEHLVTGHALYERLQGYVLSEEELQENHFPRPEGVGRAKFYLSDITKDPYLPSDERFCVRCTKAFRVNNHGKPLFEDECMYHWAKPQRKKLGNSFESRHRCCQGENGSTGCEISTSHVHHKNKFDGSSGYMTTPHKSMSEEGPGVFAMDCEMVYTTAGVELVRVTVVNSECNVIYETLVKPDHEVLDYNTRFSGVQESDMRGVTTTLIQVQAVLLHYFSADSILIGHSLESDLQAVKLVHSTVIDTSVMYPHRVGRPFKRALKNLTHDYLNTTIQEGVGGHDSQEDAVAAMRLVHYRLHQDEPKKH